MTTNRVDSFDKKRKVIFIIDILSDDAGTGTDGITKDIFSGCGYVTIADFIQNSTVVGRNQIMIIINLFREGCYIKELLDYFKLFIYSEGHTGGTRCKGRELISEDAFRGRDSDGYGCIIGKQQFIFDLT